MSLKESLKVLMGDTVTLLYAPKGALEINFKGVVVPDEHHIAVPERMKPLLKEYEGKEFIMNPRSAIRAFREGEVSEKQFKHIMKILET
jgi:hypothetical protein